MSHIPKEVIAKNFQTSIAAWDHIPEHELYIIPSSTSSYFKLFSPANGCALAPPADDQQPPVSPHGAPPNPFTFKFSKVPATQVAGGTSKIVDSRTFKVSTSIAAAEVTVEPGAMRELHVSLLSLCVPTSLIKPLPQWHPLQDEWAYFM